MDKRMRWRVGLGTSLAFGAVYKGVDVMLAPNASANGLPPELFWLLAVLMFAFTWWPYLRRLRVSFDWPFVFLQPEQWLTLSTRHPTLLMAHDKGFKFLFLRVRRVTFSTMSPDPINVEIDAEWGGPSGQLEQGTAINEVSAGVVSISDDSPIQVKDLRYILPESRWENLLSKGDDLDDLTVSLVATDIHSGCTESWDLGYATRDGEREIQLTPLDLRIETGRAYIEEEGQEENQYSVIVEDCVLTNCTDERMNVSGSLIVEYEGGWKLGTDPLVGERDTPKLPFTVGEDSWAGDLAFRFVPNIPEANRFKTVGGDMIHATLEFRDSRSPGRYATKKVAFKLPASLRPSNDDT